MEILLSGRLAGARCGVAASALLPVPVALLRAFEAPEAALDLNEGDRPGIPGNRLVQALRDREADTHHSPSSSFSSGKTSSMAFIRATSCSRRGSAIGW